MYSNGCLPTYMDELTPAGVQNCWLMADFAGKTSYNISIFESTEKYNFGWDGWIQIYIQNNVQQCNPSP